MLYPGFYFIDDRMWLLQYRTFLVFFVYLTITECPHYMSCMCHSPVWRNYSLKINSVIQIRALIIGGTAVFIAIRFTEHIFVVLHFDIT